MLKIGGLCPSQKSRNLSSLDGNGKGGDSAQERNEDEQDQKIEQKTKKTNKMASIYWDDILSPQALAIKLENLGGPEVMIEVKV